MSDCKAAPAPFLLGVKLETKCSTPLVDATLYRQLVGSLIYLTHTCPNISFVVGMVSRFMKKPHELHWKEAKRILHYMQGTHRHGIHYAVGIGLQLVGYTNSNYVGDIDSRKSTLGYLFHLGFVPICLQIKEKNIISPS